MKKPTNWPLVDPKDDGIRPAGKPDECFYCNQQVGTPHAGNCVMVTKRVRLKCTVEYEVDLPHAWTNEDIDFHYNGSTSCASNVVREIQEYDDTVGCLCGNLRVEMVGVVDEEPKRKLQGDEQPVITGNN